MDTSTKWFGLSIAMFGFAMILGSIAGLLAEIANYSGELLVISVWGVILVSASSVFLFAYANGFVDLFSRGWSRISS